MSGTITEQASSNENARFSGANAVQDDFVPACRNPLHPAGSLERFVAFDNIPDSWYFVFSLSNRGE